DAFPRRGEHRVAHAVAAAVVLKRGGRRLPRRGPVRAARVVAQVDVAPARVGRDVVVAVAGEAAQPGVLIKGVAARRVRDQAEVRLTAQVVDPGERRVRPGDDIFAILVVKVAVLHPVSLSHSTTALARITLRYYSALAFGVRSSV